MSFNIKTEYDAEADALMIYLPRKKQSPFNHNKTIEDNGFPSFVFDMDEDKNIMAIEILDASQKYEI